MADDPNQIAGLIAKVPPEMQGAIMAMAVAFLRVVYDRKETQPLRIALESVLCGAISLTISYGIMAMGMDMKWAVFGGGAVGYLGPVTVRMFAYRFIGSRIER